MIEACVRHVLLVLTQILIFQSAALAESREFSTWFKQDVISRYTGLLTKGARSGLPFAWSSQSNELIHVSDVQETSHKIINENPHILFLKDLAQKNQIEIYLEGYSSLDLIDYSINYQKSKFHPEKYQANKLDHHFSSIFPFSDGDTGFQLAVMGADENISKFKNEISQSIPSDLINIKLKKISKKTDLSFYAIDLNNTIISNNIVNTILNSKIEIPIASKDKSAFQALNSLLNITYMMSRYALNLSEEVRSVAFDLKQQGLNEFSLSKEEKIELNEKFKLVFLEAENVQKTRDVFIELDKILKLTKILEMPHGYQDSYNRGWLQFVLFKQPIDSFSVGKGLGAKASQLGITKVTHQTSWDYYKAITSSASRRPNILISRKENSTETARRGNGFYTMKGADAEWHPDKGDYKIVFNVHPDARLGKDFFMYNHEVIFLNLNALETSSDQLVPTASSFFKSLLEKSELDPNYYRHERKILLNILTNTSERQEIDQMIHSFILDAKHKNKRINDLFVNYYLKLPMSTLTGEKVVRTLAAQILEQARHRTGSHRQLVYLLNSAHIHLFQEEIIDYIRTPKYNGDIYLAANIEAFMGSQALKQAWVLDAFVNSGHIESVLKYLSNIYPSQDVVKTISILQSHTPENKSNRPSVKPALKNKCELLFF